MSRILFYAGLLFSLSPWASPPLALALGLGFGLFLTHPEPKRARTFSRFLLQCSVVGLGFGMNLNHVMRAGQAGFIYTALGIAITLTIGLMLAHMLRVTRTAGYLISVGTAICGGSAIAAVGPVAGATEEEMSVSLGTVFILNSIALLTFPAIGLAFGLGQEQFGLWAALAIHDTSSVVGASAKFGPAALAVGTTVKLARALWIVPLTVGTAFFKQRGERGATQIQWPWFILFFCMAAAANTYISAGAPVFGFIRRIAVATLTATLFLIGSSISRETLQKVGVRALLQGVILWLIVAMLSLALIRGGVIGI